VMLMSSFSVLLLQRKWSPPRDVDPHFDKAVAFRRMLESNLPHLCNFTRGIFHKALFPLQLPSKGVVKMQKNRKRNTRGRR
jgi:hypothetical protein